MVDLQKGLVGHWTMDSNDLDGVFVDRFIGDSLGGEWETFGESNGSISVSDGELEIEQTEGGGSNTNLIGVRSKIELNVGATLRVRVKNTHGRHAGIIGLTNGGSQAFPHGSETGNPSMTLYSRADAETAVVSMEDENGDHPDRDSLPEQDYTEFRTLEIKRPGASTVEVYADGEIQGTFEDVDFGEAKEIYFVADGHTTPNRIVVDWVSNVSEVTDSSANDNHGAVVGSPAVGVDSVIGESFRFTGISSNSYIDVPNSVQDELNGNKEASLSVWAKLPSNTPDNGDDTGLCSFEASGSSNTHWVWTNGDGYFPTFRTERVDNVPTDGIDLTNWHLLTITTKPGSNGWKCYVNAKEIYSVDGESTVSVDADCLIGFNNSSHYFKGDLAEFRLYNRSLSQKEINALYNMRNQKVRRS